MYSLVRLFDKKKMECFDENYKQSHLYLSQRKFNKAFFVGLCLCLINSLHKPIFVDIRLGVNIILRNIVHQINIKNK